MSFCDLHSCSEALGYDMALFQVFGDGMGGYTLLRFTAYWALLGGYTCGRCEELSSEKLQVIDD
jgi:hypothetical protein